MAHSIEDVREYWNSHLNLTQFLDSERDTLSSEEVYQALAEALKRHQYKERLLSDFARGREGQRLLEIGSGLGVELAQLAELGFHVTGIDLAPKAVELCNENLQRRGLLGSAVVGNAEDLQFDDESFEAVYSSGVLQHTPNIERAIDELWRVLKPNGSILIILYHRHSWFYLLHRISGFNIEFASDDAPIINTYRREDLRRLFSKFRDVEIATEYYYPARTNRRGLLAGVFNNLMVPAARLLPRPFIRRFGWHLVLTATR